VYFKFDESEIFRFLDLLKIVTKKNTGRFQEEQENEISDKICIRIFTGRCCDVHCQGRNIQMNRQKVREHYPHPWLLIEAIKARSEGGKRVLLLYGYCFFVGNYNKK